MDIAASIDDGLPCAVAPWDAPWPGDDEVQADADAAWAVALGLVDDGGFGRADESPEGYDAASAADTPAELLDELEHHVRARHRATAAEFRLIRRLLHDAVDDLEPWVGPDPTLDVEWSDVRGRTVAAVRRDRRDMAERAAVAEIATRLRLSEQTVRARAAQVQILHERCARVWDAFAQGRVSERHVVEASRLAGSLPDDDPASWRAFDEGALDRARRLPPARFAVSARALRERVHSESIETRHRRAARDRGVWVTPELDGMATLTALLPADRAYDALARVDRAARHLRAVPDEERTLSELRADAFADLLTRPVAATGGGGAGGTVLARPGMAPGGGGGSAARTRSGMATGGDGVVIDDARFDGDAGVGGGTLGDLPGDSRTGARPAGTTRPAATVVVTIPAFTLLGAGTEPAVVDGYGPIDLATARRLAGNAMSWVRVLTHPVTGTPIALDRSTYRVPTALRRWLGVLSPDCAFPGCARPARECDLDHLTAWSDGGGTDDDNLAPECRHHHRIRHETEWQPDRDPVTGELRWTSPLGAVIAEDPPPF